jgi:hypothetical protein
LKDLRVTLAKAEAGGKWGKREKSVVLASSTICQSHAIADPIVPDDRNSGV